MLAIILVLFICVGIAALVVGLVAVPARREGRVLLTTRGQMVMTSLRDRQTGGSNELQANVPLPSSSDVMLADQASPR